MQIHSMCAVSKRQGLELDRHTLKVSVMAMLIEVTPTKRTRQRSPIEYMYGLTEKVDVEDYACPGSS